MDSIEKRVNDDLCRKWKIISQGSRKMVTVKRSLNFMHISRPGLKDF